ncbi:MAG: Gfo/Idh/MocA family oxidoreductase [Chloroflexota bacterium]|nr:MAG: Gfo/Idh/MocA family oxidoreductase [Chloroflexota bacterium]
MNRPVRIGIVGAGFIARIHAEAYHRLPGPGVELRAVCASRGERAQAFAATHRIERVAGSVEELLGDPEIDVIDLCVPNHLHAPFGVAAARAGKHLIVEKPLTGAFEHVGNPRALLAEALVNADALLDSCDAAGVRLMYAENWVYAPSIQKARRLFAAARAPILRIEGEESHSGSHAEYARRWATAGGGSLLGKGCHPLGAAFYLKRAEGQARLGRPIRPVEVIGATARLTSSEAYRASSRAFLRGGWIDVEDWGTMVVMFDDGTVAQITAADTVLGGIKNYLVAYGANAVVQANINPNTAVVAYAPTPDVFGDEYIAEKIETKAGWTFPAPDEDFMTGYPAEIEDFVRSARDGSPPLSDGHLARDVIATIYGAYVSAAEGTRIDLRPFLHEE